MEFVTNDNVTTYSALSFMIRPEELAKTRTATVLHLSTTICFMVKLVFPMCKTPLTQKAADDGR